MSQLVESDMTTNMGESGIRYVEDVKKKEEDDNKRSVDYSLSSSSAFSSSSSFLSSSASQSVAESRIKSAPEGIDISGVVCRYDPKCENPKCGFKHPSAGLYCEKGKACEYYYCRKRHPYGRMKKCDYNKKCWNYYCKYLHGKGRNPCKLGRNCPNSNGICKKVHPPSKSDDMVEKSDDMVEGPDLNILLIGETGSGKSTLINTVTNFCRKGSIDKLRVAIPTKHRQATEEFDSKELDLHNGSVSQTDACHSYRFAYKRRMFNFIDSPGLGDTRGIEQDNRNTDKILEAGAKYDNIAALVFVINGTTSRLTSNLKSVIARFRGFIPDILLQNTIVVFTHCWEHNRTFDLESFASELKSTKVFHLDNSVFCSDPKGWTSNCMQRIQSDWFESLKEVKNMFDYFLNMRPIHTNFISIKKSRDAIAQALHTFQLQVANLQALQLKFEEAERESTKYHENEKQFQNYKQTKTITETKLVNAERHSTICSQCNVICHQDCGLNEISSPGSEEFKDCACMRQGRCTTCKGQCSFHSHYHARKKFQTTTRTLETVLEDIKKKFENAQNQKKKQIEMIESVKDAKTVVKKAIKAEKELLLAECTKLKKICAHFNLVDEMHEKLTQLKAQARIIQTNAARQSAEEIIKTIEKVCDELK